MTFIQSRIYVNASMMTSFTALLLPMKQKDLLCILHAREPLYSKFAVVAGWLQLKWTERIHFFVYRDPINE